MIPFIAHYSPMNNTLNSFMPLRSGTLNSLSFQPNKMTLLSLQNVLIGVVRVSQVRAFNLLPSIPLLLNSHRPCSIVRNERSSVQLPTEGISHIITLFTGVYIA